MVQQVLRERQTGIDAAGQEEVNCGFSLWQNKYKAALQRAEELLHASDTYAPAINDSLNCGKLNKKFVECLREIFRPAR